MKVVNIGVTFCLAVAFLSLSSTCFGDKKPLTDALASAAPKPATCINDPDPLPDSTPYTDPKALDLLLKNTFNAKDLKGHGPDTKPLDPDGDTAYIFHVTSWTDGKAEGGVPVMRKSVWYAYRCKKGVCHVKYAPSNTPLLYNPKHAVLVSIEAFPFVEKSAPAPARATVSLSYSFVLTQQTAANVASVKSALGAVLGIAAPKPAGALPLAVPPITTDSRSICVAQFPIDPASSDLPYDIKVTVTNKAATDKAAADKVAADQAAANSAVTAAIATGNPDTVKAAVDQAIKTAEAKAAPDPAAGNTPSPLTQTFHALDREWWDLGIGMSTIPLRQTVVTTANGTSKLSTVNRINPYGFFDVYPFFTKFPKNTPWVPHFQVGVPLSGQPLHRPYAGIGLPLPWIERYMGFTVGVFGGIDFMRSQYASTESPHWVKKRVIGVELPVGQLLGKISAIKSK